MLNQQLSKCALTPCLWLGAVKRQEKALRAKLRLQQGEDEDGDDEPDDEEDDGLWGGKKRAYYGEADQEEARARPPWMKHA